MSNTYGNLAVKRAQLIQDGRRALSMAGIWSIADILARIGGSRPRLYRAMAAAREADAATSANRRFDDAVQQAIDPLLE